MSRYIICFRTLPKLYISKILRCLSLTNINGNLSFDFRFYLYLCIMNKLIIPSKTERLIQKNDFFLTRGHDFIEIGGIKWATCNIGAKNPADTGFYFQWGNTKGYTAEEMISGKINFSSHSYELNFGEVCHITNKDILRLNYEHDAAHVNWGGAWRMPTTEDFLKLASATIHNWIKNYKKSGINGLLFTDIKDKSKQLFLPAAGYAYGSKISLMGVDGSCWTSNSVVGRGNTANSIITREISREWNASDYIYYGFPIRPILG